MIYLPPLTHIRLIKASRETADSRLYQHDVVSVRQHCASRGSVPGGQVVARSGSAKIYCPPAAQLKIIAF